MSRKELDILMQRKDGDGNIEIHYPITKAENVKNLNDQVKDIVSESGEYISVSEKGAARGVAQLDDGGKVPPAQLPAMDYDPSGSAATVQNNLNTHKNDKANPHGVTAAQVQAISASSKGTAGGVAELGADGKVPAGQLPEMNYDTKGSAEAVQINLNTHTENKSNPHEVTKAQMGLGNVDNTSDVNKPVSTAQKTAIDAVEKKADKAQETADKAQTAVNSVEVSLEDMLENMAKIHITVTQEALQRTTAAVLSPARQKLAAATDGNGSVLFAGGSASSETSGVVEKYTKDGVKSKLENLQAVRIDMGAAADGNGNVLFGGGNGLALVDRYTPSGVRSSLENLAAAKNSPGTAGDGNGNVLFGGGANSPSTVEKYTPTGVKSNLENLSAARSGLSASKDGNGNVLFGGGTATNVVVSAVMDKYTPAGVRSSLKDLQTARYDLTACTDGNGNVLFGGGRTGTANNAVVATVDKYTPNGTQSSLNALQSARSGPAAAAERSGCVIFAGGLTSSTSGLVDMYSPAGSRSTLANLSADRRDLAGATDGRGNALFGGGYSSTYSAVVDKYGYPNKELHLMPNIKYKFEDDTEEKTVPEGGIISVPVPNKGYVRFGGSITI